VLLQWTNLFQQPCLSVAGRGGGARSSGGQGKLARADDMPVHQPWSECNHRLLTLAESQVHNEPTGVTNVGDDRAMWRHAACELSPR
jgi:hypothetical protein